MRLRFFLFQAFIIAFHVIGFSQDAAPLIYAKKITPGDMRPFLEVLASDSLEGRETGKPGQKKAASFIAAHFREIGLKPVMCDGYFQVTPLNIRANKGTNFRVNEKEFLYMRDYFYPEGVPDTQITVERVKFIRLGPEATENREKVKKSKGVFVIAPEVPGIAGVNRAARSDAEMLSLAEKQGASLVLIATDSIERIIDAYRCGSGMPGPANIPFAFISVDMAKSFFPEGNNHGFEKCMEIISQPGKRKTIDVYAASRFSFVKNTDAMCGENVIGYLEGTGKKDEVIVITAHYDHLGVRDSAIYHGADDNGSGTSAVMEIAKRFSEAAAEGHRPRRSIMFMTVSGEEKGLLGSSYYVSHPAIPLEQTMVDLNIDMIGRTDIKHDSLHVRDYVYIIGSDKLSTSLHAVNEKVNSEYTRLELDYTYNRSDDPNRYYYRSDHYNFARNNIPVIFYFNGPHVDYHRPTDTVDKIQFDLLAERTQLVFLTAWELTNREERIVVDVVNDMQEKKEE